MQSTSDDVLIGRIATGDRLAMQVLFARHHVRVYRFVLRLVRDESVAEDLISEVFLDVWRQAGRFEGRSRFPPGCWRSHGSRPCRRFGVGRTRNWTRKRPRQSRIPQTILKLPCEKKDKSAAIRKCLEKLSAEHREIIDLVYYHEKSVEEVAEIVGIPENTVKTRMFYARKRLAELLKAAGIERGWP